MKTLTPHIIRCRLSEEAKSRIRAKAEFVIPASDVIRGVEKALQPAATKAVGHARSACDGDGGDGGGEGESGPGAGEEVPKAVG